MKNPFRSREFPHRKLATLPLLLLLSSIGCGDEAQTTVVQAPPVLVRPVELHEVLDHIEASGRLLARSQASVAAQVGGQITHIRVDEGAAVEAGQVILEI